MKIGIGDYTLNSDQWSMWITKKYKSEKTGKVADKRITGYRLDLDALLSDFRHRQVFGSDAETMKEVIEVLKQTMADMDAMKKTAIEQDFRRLRKIAKEKVK